MPPVVRIVGKSNSGKTRVMVALVAELKGRGYRVAAIKHCPHGHQLDQEGKDSYRIFAAGADAVIAASPEQSTLVRRTEVEPSLREHVASLGDGYDVVLAEGFQAEPALTIQVVTGDDRPLPVYNGELLATVGDKNSDGPVANYTFEQIPALADLLEARLSLSPDRRASRAIR